MKTTYSTCCVTALVIFGDMRVPIENLMSREDDGFKQVMHNFNHVRWMLTNNLVGQGRAVLADTFMYAKRRPDGNDEVPVHASHVEGVGSLRADLRRPRNYQHGHGCQG